METNPIPQSKFAEAFCKLMKCKHKDIYITMMVENLEAFVEYKDHRYKVGTRAGFWEDIYDMLADAEYASRVSLSIWIAVTKNSVTIGRFLPNLVKKLKGIEQARMLRLALSINSYSEDKYQTFWRTIESIDHTGVLLANAIVSAREIYNGDGLIDDITEMMILSGAQVYNQLVEGIFETVYLDDNETPEFFVYSVAE